VSFGAVGFWASDPVPRTETKVTDIPSTNRRMCAPEMPWQEPMRLEGPDLSQIVGLTGFMLSAAVILSIIVN
jgi:hypothetical protein